MTDLHLPDANQIPCEDIPAALTQLAALQAAIAVRMMTDNAIAKDEPRAEDDAMLTVKQAAELLNVSGGWLYRRYKTLPFSRKISEKGLRFSKRGLLVWRDRRRPQDRS